MHERFYTEELVVRLLLRAGYRIGFIDRLNHDEKISLLNYTLKGNDTYVDEDI